MGLELGLGMFEGRGTYVDEVWSGEETADGVLEDCFVERGKIIRCVLHALLYWNRSVKSIWVHG